MTQKPKREFQAVFQAPQAMDRIMPYKLTGYEWTAIKSMLPNTLRGDDHFAPSAFKGGTRPC